MLFWWNKFEWSRFVAKIAHSYLNLLWLLKLDMDGFSSTKKPDCDCFQGFTNNSMLKYQADCELTRCHISVWSQRNQYFYCWRNTLQCPKPVRPFIRTTGCIPRHSKAWVELQLVEGRVLSKIFCFCTSFSWDVFHFVLVDAFRHFVLVSTTPRKFILVAFSTHSLQTPRNIISSILYLSIFVRNWYLSVAASGRVSAKRQDFRFCLRGQLSPHIKW